MSDHIKLTQQQCKFTRIVHLTSVTLHQTYTSQCKLTLLCVNNFDVNLHSKVSVQVYTKLTLLFCEILVFLIERSCAFQFKFIEFPLTFCGSWWHVWLKFSECFHVLKLPLVDLTCLLNFSRNHFQETYLLSWQAGMVFHEFSTAWIHLGNDIQKRTSQATLSLQAVMVFHEMLWNTV